MTRNRFPGGESLRFIWNEVIQRHDHRPAAFSGLAVFGTDYWEFQIFRGGKGLSLMGRFGGVKKLGGRFSGIAFMVIWLNGVTGLKGQGSDLMVAWLAVYGFEAFYNGFLMGSISF